jgi:hypothetical protein
MRVLADTAVDVTGARSIASQIAFVDETDARQFRASTGFDPKALPP